MQGSLTGATCGTRMTSDAAKHAAVQPTDAPFPFNSPHADVILQSCDGVNFRVRKAILAEASPIFGDMFSLPVVTDQPTQANHQSNEALDLPVVPMTEDSAIMSKFLRLCYPTDREQETFDDVSSLLPVARKYAMNWMEGYLVQVLRRTINTEPLRAYCIAIRYSLSEDVVRTAARGFLNESIQTSPIHPGVSELGHISASAYLRLLDYRRRCSAVVEGVACAVMLADAQLAKRCWASCASRTRIQLSLTARDHCYTCVVLAPDRDKHEICAWFLDFVTLCGNMVKDRPSGKDLTTQAAVARALLDAGRCLWCRDHAWDDIQAYLQLLSEKIDNKTSWVSLEIVH
ncbi:hypothetical protein DAEQUDRAFT_149317 [Daedalea quercina L-15889]|uniref:BTB domain-containing protein n=1 Tax=Daedalea quercina L-15889 TaxID=1314783 RepID=A0A165KM41_9APHY|nr:hypothetical protein DAEQUDRAFT_149317 [Daedalea quercina L-15889]